MAEINLTRYNSREQFKIFTIKWLFPKPGLQSRALCGAVCIINSYSTFLNWPIVSLLILFILFSMFLVLIHDYTLCFTDFPCRNFSYMYYNYISIWPYYIGIHITHICWFLLIFQFLRYWSLALRHQASELCPRWCVVSWGPHISPQKTLYVMLTHLYVTKLRNLSNKKRY